MLPTCSFESNDLHLTVSICLINTNQFRRLLVKQVQVFIFLQYGSIASYISAIIVMIELSVRVQHWYKYVRTNKARLTIVSLMDSLKTLGF